MKAVNSQTRNEKATRGNGWQSLGVQDCISNQDKRYDLNHLKQSTIKDEMVTHLLSAIVMRSLLQLERKAA